ncbi:MAG: hypothetical protein P8P99_05350 [Maricaulis sp.]|nr:hypothetical protein [Maricaulis sp.]
MLGQFASAIIALQGMFRLIAFQPNWEWHFDMSMRGFWGSFGAALFTLPIFFLFIACQRYFGADTDLGQYLVIYIALWISYPLTAAGVVIVSNRQDAYVPWIVLHNWSFMARYLIITSIWLLYVAGVIDRDMLALLATFYEFILRPIIHWRVAVVALGVPAGQGALAAAIPTLIDLMLVEGLIQFFEASAG